MALIDIDVNGQTIQAEAHKCVRCDAWTDLPTTETPAGIAICRQCFQVEKLLPNYLKKRNGRDAVEALIAQIKAQTPP
jgi:late competence protein required for DNA uptake (superfamily II DNA/RNA helicase)